MSNYTVKTWKDRSFFLSLSESEQAQVPANPAGVVELDPSALHSVTGGAFIDEADGTVDHVDWTCCPGVPACNGNEGGRR